MIDGSGRGFEEKFTKLLERAGFNQANLKLVYTAAIFPSDAIKWVYFTDGFVQLKRKYKNLLN